MYIWPYWVGDSLSCNLFLGKVAQLVLWHRINRSRKGVLWECGTAKSQVVLSIEKQYTVSYSHGMWDAPTTTWNSIHIVPCTACNHLQMIAIIMGTFCLQTTVATSSVFVVAAKSKPGTDLPFYRRRAQSFSIKGLPQSCDASSKPLRARRERSTSKFFIYRYYLHCIH